MKPVSPVLPGYEMKEIVYAKDQPQYNPLPAVVIEARKANPYALGIYRRRAPAYREWRVSLPLGLHLWPASAADLLR